MIIICYQSQSVPHFHFWYNRVYLRGTVCECVIENISPSECLGEQVGIPTWEVLQESRVVTRYLA